MFNVENIESEMSENKKKRFVCVFVPKQSKVDQFCRTEGKKQTTNTVSRFAFQILN